MDTQKINTEGRGGQVLFWLLPAKHEHEEGAPQTLRIPEISGTQDGEKDHFLTK